MQEHWDVIIVGARCAGATLATILARRGLRVLLLEASERGTNMPMSTHFVQSPGMAVLDRIGVAERVRAVTPASRRFRYAFDDVALIANSGDGPAPYCVRRSTLDPWLQETAEQAGAELRCRQRVIELIKEGERVTGVVVRNQQGNERLYADLVVGADGFRSTIAQLTAAPEYLVSKGSRSGYFTYYEAPREWTHNWDASLEHLGTDVRYVMRCDDEHVLLAYFGPQPEVAGWGARHRECFEAKLLTSRSTRTIAEGKRPVGPVVGMTELHYFYRTPVGPGYALVGDAGHFKDIITGQGMADAFLDAERLAIAILDGRDAAYQHYWRERDVATLPLHFDAIKQGRVGHNEPFMRWLIARMAADPVLGHRVIKMLAREIEPSELVPGRELLAALGSALANKRWEVLLGFLQAAKQSRADALELGARKKLLAVARAELARAAPLPRKPRAKDRTTTLQTELV